MRFWRIAVAISIISALSCLKHNNPFDMNDPNYEPPTVRIDSSSVNSGDSTGQESIVITVSGNKPEVEIRWQLDSLAWSPWQEQGTITVSGYGTGRHTITIEGWYGGGGEIVDTNISFVKVNAPTLTVDTSSQLDDSLVIISEGTLCTLQVSASATGTPRYYWYRDLTIIDSTSGNRLIVGPTTVKDTGSYFVVVSNAWGSDTSRTVLLRYRNAPLHLAVLLDISITEGVLRLISPATLQVKENDTLRFTVTVSDPAYSDDLTSLAGRNMPFENQEFGVGAFNAATGEFWFVPDFSVSSQERNEKISDLRFVALDLGYGDSIEVDILVENVNRAPTIGLVSPTNGAQGVAQNGIFKWSGKDPDNDQLTYTMFLGILPDQFEQVYRGADTSFADKTLFGNGQTYYWKVVTNDGISQSESSVRSITLNNLPAILLSRPANGSIAWDVPLELSWQGSDPDTADRDQLLYDVYLGRENEPTSRVAENRNASSLLLSSIDFGTRYEWKIVAKDGKDSVSSPTYSFQTASVAKIVTHPKSQTAINSKGASFNVETTGEGTIEYQWQKNGEDISGANESSYTIGAVNTTDHNALIRCIVSNGFGTPDTSDSAILAVSFIVRAGQSLHASISPLMDTVPLGGESAVFTVVPAEGWFLDGVYSGSDKIGNNAVFTIKDIRADLVIQAKCGSWEYVGSPNVSNGDAFSVHMEVVNNQPIIAYQDVANNRALGVKMYDSTQKAWQNVGDAPALLGATVWGISLAVENNQPFIAVTEPGFASKVTVIKLVSGTWQVVGTRGFSEYSAAVTDICVSSGVPYVAYVRSGFGNSRKLIVMRYNGGSWEYINESEISTDYANNPKICINSGRPFVAFQDWAKNGKVSVKWNSGAGYWSHYGVPNEPDTVKENEALFIDMKFDNDVPYVFYQSALNPNGGILRYQNGSWTHLPGSEFNAWDISLDFFMHTPYISYMDLSNDAKATVMKWNSGVWDTIGKKGFTAEPSYETTVRVINGTPYLSYRNTSAHVMRYGIE